MRSFGFAALAAALWLWPAVGSADTASSYVQAALSQPAPVLGAEALKKNPEDALRLGLAMLAGRPSGIATDDADDAAKLRTLEAHIGPQVNDYLKSHPGADAGRVNWPVVTMENTDDANFVEHYLQVHSADYWLEQAIYAVHGDVEMQPRHATDDPQKNAASKIYNTVQYSRTIDTNLVMAAAQCVVAVRRAAGLGYQPWSTLPLSIRLLQRLPRQDMQMKVDTDLNAKGAHFSYPTGAAACGTDDQFKADVAALKAGT
jgi:hypothetical protein